MKKVFLSIVILAMAIIPPIQAQTKQQQQEIDKITEDLSDDKITVQEYMKLMKEIMTRPDTTPVSSQLATPAGKAWVIQDNQIQGSGKAMVIKSDGGFEGYVRRLGVWSPHADNLYSTTTYTATGSTLNIRSNDNYYNRYAGNYTYTISNNGSMLTITGDNHPENIVNGTYTLKDLPKIQGPGGDIVNPAGTAWETYPNAGAHYIYSADGIHYLFGGSGSAGPWAFENVWQPYTVNSTAGKVIYLSHNKQRVEHEITYSVTDFGGGNKTMRIWQVSRDAPVDDVRKLVPTPRGFKLPEVR